MTKEQVIAALESELALAEEDRRRFSGENDTGSFTLEMHYAGRASGLRLALSYIKDMKETGSNG